MLQRLSTELNTLHALVDSFQLLDVQLPPRFAEARVRQLNAVQEKEAAANEKRVAEISAQTRINQTAIEVESILVNASKDANARLISAEADVNQITQRLGAEADGFASIAAQLGLSPDELLEYIYIDALEEGRERGRTVTLRVPRGGFTPFQ